MNQFMKILIVILFGLCSLNGIQAFGVLPETEASCTCFDNISEFEQCSLDCPVQKFPENICSDNWSEDLYPLIFIRPQNFFVQGLSAYWNRQGRAVSFYSVSNCFSWYKKVVLSSEMNRQWSCSSFHRVSFSGRSIAFSQRKIIV